MSDASPVGVEGVLAKVAEWRSRAMVCGQYSVECDASMESEHRATAETLTECADELEALALAPRPVEGPATVLAPKETTSLYRACEVLGIVEGEALAPRQEEAVKDKR